MPAGVTWWMKPQRLNDGIKKATLASFKVAHKDAQARRHNTSKSDVRLRVDSTKEATLLPKGLQGVFEVGREGGYPEYPGGVIGIRRSGRSGSRIGLGRKGIRTGGVTGTGARALLITSGSLGGQFFAHIEGGPMRPYPAMGPAARDWARGGYQATAKAILAAEGFRARL